MLFEICILEYIDPPHHFIWKIIKIAAWVFVFGLFKLSFVIFLFLL